MRTDRLAAMLSSAVAFDTETHMIQPGLLAPPMVCASLAEFVPDAGRVVGALLDKDRARSSFQALLNGPYTIVGANIAYDMLVMAYDAARRGIDLMPGIFAAYEAARVYDLQIAEALHAVATGYLGKDPRTSSDPSAASPLKDPETGKQGRYSLNIVADLVLGRRDAKANDRFRSSYALLEDTPIEQWPPEARIYPVDDACNTLEIALAQAGHLARPAGHVWSGTRCVHCEVGIKLNEAELPPCRPRKVTNYNLHNLAAQAYAAWAMHLGAAWGFRVDPEAVDALEDRVTKARESEIEVFIRAGMLKYKREPKQSLDAIEARVIKSLTATGSPAHTAAALGMTEETVRNYIAKLTAQGALSTSKSTSTIKRRVAIAYGCRTPCVPCAGSGKVPSEKTGNPIGCTACGSTGLDLSTAPVPRTDGEGVGTSRDALSESGDELLIDFAAFTEEAKILETYIPFLRQGIDEMGRPRPITLRPNVLLDTGRASYGDVVQQLPRGGGVRECIIARPGTVLCSCDYGGLELATHSQSCLWIVGYSRLAEALNKEIKVHDALAATFLGVTYEEFAAGMAGERGPDIKKLYKNVRQAVKPANFGFPGGMGAVKLVLQQRKQGPDTTAANGRKYKGLRFCILLGAHACGENPDGTSNKLTEYKRKTITPTCGKCIEVAEDIRKKWFSQWPENEDYFKFITDATEHGQLVTRDGRDFRLNPAQIMQHCSHRLRGATEFCSAANGFFQGLAADGAKRALTRVAREQYDRTFRLADGSMSPLFGTRTILFAHDELVVEMPENYAHEASMRLSVVMVESMREYTPDVRVEAPPALMRRWYKGAEEVYLDPSGKPCKSNAPGARLVPWEPSK